MGDAEVRRTEVVTPLTDAVCLIDCDKAHIHATQLLEEHFARKPFWRDIKELVSAEDAVLQDGQHLFVRHVASNESGLDAMAFEGFHLVLHQRDKWREDDADTLHGKRRHLESDALAASGRHQGKRIAPRPYALDDLALYPAKVIVMPILLKD